MLTQIVHTGEITEDTSPIEVLNIALEREINTKNNYEMFLELVKMDETLIDAFEMLRNKEQEHIRIIKRKMNELKG
jgi:rubrerythrin